jgi:hypothetical protein
MLAEHFDQPPAYLRSLYHLMDFYADRARRPGQSGLPSPLVAAYNVRPPVLRQIVQELIPLVQADPEQGLALCDALWEQPVLEFRTLAAMLLGQLPTDPPERITARARTWIAPDLEPHLIKIVLVHALARLRQEQPAVLVRLFQDWIESSDKFHQQLGLQALLPLIRDPGFENLPVFFRTIQPLARQAPPVLRPDLLDVLEALAKRSPTETAYFLRQTLETPDALDTPWLIRQLMHAFPPENQSALREAMKNRETARQVASRPGA